MNLIEKLQTKISESFYEFVDDFLKLSKEEKHIAEPRVFTYKKLRSLDDFIEFETYDEKCGIDIYIGFEDTYLYYLSVDMYETIVNKHEVKTKLSLIESGQIIEEIREKIKSFFSHNKDRIKKLEYFDLVVRFRFIEIGAYNIVTKYRIESLF
jgi:hypothetical protein